MRLANRVNRISVSPTLAVLMEAEKLKARGVDVVDFGPGEPDFPTPEHIKEAAIEALRQNQTKYTPTAGIAPLREAVCNWHARTRQLLRADRMHHQRRRQARHLQRRQRPHRRRR